MKDLTQGSIGKHLASMAVFIGAGMLLQTAYLLIDLYFVASLGDAAIAGVGAAGNAMFIGLAFSQVISVGALALISQAIGRKDMDDAATVYNQAMSLSIMVAVVVLVIGYVVAEPAIRAVAPNAVTAQYGIDYLYAYLPSIAMMFILSALNAGLRGAGLVWPGMAMQSATIVLNVILAPVLIAGWGTGVPLGAFGAGLASSISVLCGFVGSFFLAGKIMKTVRLERSRLVPDREQWGRIFLIGFPSAAEFLLMFLITGVIYWATASHGAAAQAGFGIGGRVMQSILMPAMAVSFAAAPVIGQNYGGKEMGRVQRTFRITAAASTILMLIAVFLSQYEAETMIRLFTTEEAVVDEARIYLGICSWNFIAVGIAFACSSTFQGLGDTRPSILTSASRLVTFVLPVLWLGSQPDTELTTIWWLSVASVATQAVLNLVLLQREFRTKLSLGL